MTVYNVSSPYRVQGSDYDYEIRLNRAVYQIVVFLFSLVGIGQYKRRFVYRIAFFNIEVFLMPVGYYDLVSAALHDNLSIMQSWDNDTKNRYLSDKLAISGLSGIARKQAKASLAIKYSLNPIVYGL